MSQSYSKTEIQNLSRQSQTNQAAGVAGKPNSQRNAANASVAHGPGHVPAAAASGGGGDSDPQAPTKRRRRNGRGNANNQANAGQHNGAAKPQQAAQPQTGTQPVPKKKPSQAPQPAQTPKNPPLPALAGATSGRKGRGNSHQQYVGAPASSVHADKPTPVSPKLRARAIAGQLETLKSLISRDKLFNDTVRHAATQINSQPLVSDDGIAINGIYVLTTDTPFSIVGLAFAMEQYLKDAGNYLKACSLWGEWPLVLGAGSLVSSTQHWPCHGCPSNLVGFVACHHLHIATSAGPAGRDPVSKVYEWPLPLYNPLLQRFNIRKALERLFVFKPFCGDGILFDGASPRLDAHVTRSLVNHHYPFALASVAAGLARIAVQDTAVWAATTLQPGLSTRGLLTRLFVPSLVKESMDAIRVAYQTAGISPPSTVEAPPTFKQHALRFLVCTWRNSDYMAYRHGKAAMVCTVTLTPIEHLSDSIKALAQQSPFEDHISIPNGIYAVPVHHITFSGDAPTEVVVDTLYMRPCFRNIAGERFAITFDGPTTVRAANSILTLAAPLLSPYDKCPKIDPFSYAYSLFYPLIKSRNERGFLAWPDHSMGNAAWNAQASFKFFAGIIETRVIPTAEALVPHCAPIKELQKPLLAHSLMNFGVVPTAWRLTAWVFNVAVTFDADFRAAFHNFVGAARAQ